MHEQWHIRWLLVGVLMPVALAVGNNRYVQIPFDTTPIGPDGPWWGVGLSLGLHRLGKSLDYWIAYPYPGGYSQFTNQSTTTPDTVGNGEWFGPDFSFGPDILGDPLSDSWSPIGSGEGINDLSADWFTTDFDAWGNVSGVVGDFTAARLWNMPFETAGGRGGGIQSQKNNSLSFNTSAVAYYNTTVFSLPNGTQYPPSAPLFGLGGTVMGRPMSDAPPGATASIKQTGAIAAEFFALHIGSVHPSIELSLYLGGYDSSRAYGKVGAFGYQPIQHIVTDIYYPQVPLVDLRLGTVTGGSPFNFSDQSRSLWSFANITETASQKGQAVGAPKRSVLVFPNSASPYLHLPRGLCAAIAAYLPVQYNSDFGFWIWNTSSPNYPKVVKSPAYLEFVMHDLSQGNVSIKVPMQLLNLTLEAPLTAGYNTLQYLPCTEPEAEELTSEDLSPIYTLGRAFLQAAYFAVNYEQNMTFLVQAPGPGIDSNNRNIIEVNSTISNLSSNDIGQWAQTWTNSWTPLPGSTTGGSSANSTSMSGTADSDQASATSRRIGLGVGLGLGLPALAAAGILAFVLYRRRKRLQNETSKSRRGVSIMDPSPPAYEDRRSKTKSAAAGAALTSNPTSQHEVQEIDGGQARQEIDGRTATVPVVAPPVEMDAGGVSELPADFIHQGRSGAIGGLSGGHSRNVSELDSSVGALSPTTTTAPGPGSPGIVSLTSPRPLSDDGTVVSSEHEHRG